MLLKNNDKIKMSLNLSSYSKIIILFKILKNYCLFHGVLFFAFYGTYAGGENVKQIFSHRLKIHDANLNWILTGEG
jgi:hypothetical protein